MSENLFRSGKKLVSIMFFHLSANLLRDTNKMCERKIPNFPLDAAADIYKKLMRAVSLKILRINFSSIHLHVSQMQTPSSRHI